MELTPLLLRRWIFPLGLALAALSAVGLLPQLSSFGDLPGLEPFLLPLHYVTIAVLGGFATLIVLAERRGLDPRKLHFLLQASYVVLLFWMIVVLYGVYGNRNYHASAVLLPMSSSVLAAAVPGLWAAAVVRRTDPRNTDSRAYGRLSAWIAVAAIVIGSLLSAVSSITLFGPNARIMMHPSMIISSTSVTLSRALALWAVVESLRRSGTEEAVVARSRTIQGLMIAWLLLAIATQLYFTISGLFGSDILRSLTGLWRGIVYRLLMVLVAVLAAVHLERPGSSYNSATPAHP